METFEIKVKSNTSPQSLASSITAAYRDGKAVRITAIGPFPVAQAFKAVCVSNRALSSEGVMLAIIPGLESRKIIDRDTQEPTPWVVSTMRLINIMDTLKGG